MKKLILLQIFILAGMWCAVAFGQDSLPRINIVPAPSSFTNSVVIAIPDNPVTWDKLSSDVDIPVTFYVVANNDGNAVTITNGNKLISNHKVYTGSMHVRGDATANTNKKQFAVDLDSDTVGNFLGMPNGGKHWVFNDCGDFIDITMMRNVITFEMQRGMGQYAPHHEWFELFLCQPSDNINNMSQILANNYYGVYLNFDKITFEKDRITDVTKNKAPKKTDLENGNYALIQLNQLAPSKYKTLDFQTPPAHAAEVYEPKLKDYEKASYAGAFNTVNNWYTNWTTPSVNLFNNNFPLSSRDTTGNATNIKALRNTTDYESFVTYFLINEITKDQDGYHKSTFMVKKKDVCYAGPLWDKNKSYGNTWIAEPTYNKKTKQIDSLWNLTPHGWLFAFYDTQNPDGNQAAQWWSSMLVDTNYCNMIWETWQTEKDSNNYLDTTYLNALIDTEIQFLNNMQGKNDATYSALQRNNKCWQNGGNTTLTEYYGQVAQLKKYLKERINWIDANLEDLLTTYCPTWTKPS